MTYGGVFYCKSDSVGAFPNYLRQEVTTHKPSDRRYYP